MRREDDLGSRSSRHWDRTGRGRGRGSESVSDNEHPWLVVTPYRATRHTQQFVTVAKWTEGPVGTSDIISSTPPLGFPGPGVTHSCRVSPTDTRHFVRSHFLYLLKGPSVPRTRTDPPSTGTPLTVEKLFGRNRSSRRPLLILTSTGPYNLNPWGLSYSKEVGP